jgi:hypothetical protein
MKTNKVNSTSVMQPSLLTSYIAQSLKFLFERERQEQEPEQGRATQVTSCREERGGAKAEKRINGVSAKLYLQFILCYARWCFEQSDWGVE